MSFKYKYKGLELDLYLGGGGVVLFCLFIYFGECAFFNKGIKSNNVSHNSFVLFS